MKKLVLAMLCVAMVVPAIGHAAPVTYTAPFALGPQGGDANNKTFTDASTGSVTVIRHQYAGIGGGLGCGGQGGWSYLRVNHTATDPVSSVTVTWTEGLVDPYTFLNVGVRKGANYLGSKVVRGPVVGDGSATVTLTPPATGALEVWFGVQVGSACPNVDGGHAVFTGVTFA